MACLFMAFMLFACRSESGQRPASPAIARPTSPIATPSARSYGPRPSPPSLPVAKEDQPAVIESYFASLETACTAFVSGRPIVESVRFTEAKILSEQSPGKWLLRDGLGTELIVDTRGWVGGDPADVFRSGAVLPAKGAWIVTPTGGPEDVLPRNYAFGCPEDIFVGKADH